METIVLPHFSVLSLRRSRSLAPLRRLGVSMTRSEDQLSSGSVSTNARPAASASSNAVPAPFPPGESQDFSADSIIMEPLQDKAGVDVLVVFAIGALTPAKDYIPLCSEMQLSCGFRMWVAIINPPNNIISTEITEGSFEGLLQRIKVLGFLPGQLPMDNVFLVGHSWGAWTARTVALRRAQGFVQLGSCFHTNPDNLSQYPKPVLTLSGELDGQITLAAIAKHAGEIFDVEADMGSFNTYAVKPVIIIPGMNHAQFSHGIPNKERGDLDAKISIEEARSKAGALISAFISVHVEDGRDAQSLAKLEEAVKLTHAMCKTYWEALEQQLDRTAVKHYQLDLAMKPVEVLTEEQICVIHHDFEDNFIYSKPWIEHQEAKAAKIFINTYLNPYGKYGLVKNLWVKMKSREAVDAAFGGNEAPDSTALSRVAAKFNEQTFSEALKLVPEAACNKYMEHGRKVRFVDDLIITDSSMKWIKGDVAMVPNTDDGSAVVDVQSPVLISPLKGMARRFAGMHYMKVLTTARAMQWILIDCYR